MLKVSEVSRKFCSGVTIVVLRVGGRYDVVYFKDESSLERHIDDLRWLRVEGSFLRCGGEERFTYTERQAFQRVSELCSLLEFSNVKIV